jgi:hypothetical protein
MTFCTVLAVTMLVRSVDNCEPSFTGRVCIVNLAVPPPDDSFHATVMPHRHGTEADRHELVWTVTWAYV